MLGGVTTLAAGQVLGAGNYLLLMVVGAAVVGCVVAWFGFRLWMGVAMAAVLSASIGAAIWGWHEPASDIIDELVGDSAVTIGGENLGDWLDSASRFGTETTKTWWQRLSNVARTAIAIGAAMGGAIGLILGLLAPYWASAIISALSGTLLVTSAFAQWVRMTQWQPPTWLAEPRHKIICVSLITLIGVLIQWIFSRRRSD